MRDYLKPTIGKVIAAIIITIVGVYSINCWVFGRTIEICELAPILFIISTPLFIIFEPIIDVLDPFLSVFQKEILIFVISFLFIYFIISVLSRKLINNFEKEFGELSLYEACRTEITEWNNRNFLQGIIVGSILIIVLRNILIFGPMMSGFVAGIIAEKSGHGDSAGFLSGIAGSIFFVDISAAVNFGLFENVIRIVLSAFQTIFLYFGLMSLIGGAVSGFLIRKYVKGFDYQAQ